ncbi:MAG: Ig-like domain-containing protein, partial [Sulfitobacter sp.]
GSWVFELTDPAHAYLDQGESEFIYAYYTATDAGGASTNGRLVIEVQGINDAPVLGADSETVTIVADSPPPGVDWTQWTQDAGGNDHYYQFVTSSTLTWTAARADAAANSGYLATVTSADEQAFVTGIAAGRVAFLGGSDAIEEGTWIWVDGPEAGQQFWQSAVGGATAGPVGGSYVNWSAGQPSAAASVENVLHLFGDGSWNDLVDADTPSTTFGYVMEYSGPLNVRGSIATNDTDPEGGTLTYAATNSVQGLTLAADGTWALDQTDPNFVTLAQGETSSLALTYTATDAGGATANGTLNIIVEGANDAPSIVDDAETVAEGSGVTAFDLSLISSDPDNGDTLTYQIISAPVAGLASIVGNELRFDTNGDFAALNDGETEDVTVELRATDGSGATDTATVTVTITGDSPAITTVDDTVAPRTEDAGFTTSTASFTSNDVEPNGEALVITSVSAVSAFGAPVTLSGTNVSYSAFRSTQLNDLNAGQTVTDSFTYTVENMSGTLSATGTVRVDITGVDQIDNDPVPFGTTTVGFQSGGSGEYKINDNWLRDDDEGTGITYKFGLITADAPLPDFLTYDTSARVLLIDQAEYSELTDEGFTNLVVTGFEGDSDYTSIPFGVYITTSEGKGIMDFVLFGGGTSGFAQTLEVGLNPEFGLGPSTVGATVDLSGIESLLDPSSTSAIADVGVIDLSNGQTSSLTVIADDLLNLIEGNAPAANENILISIDSYDSVAIDADPDFAVNFVSTSRAELTGVSGDFAGLGLFATLEVDNGNFAFVA